MLKNTKRELDELRWANEALELRFELVKLPITNKVKSNARLICCNR